LRHRELAVGEERGPTANPTLELAGVDLVGQVEDRMMSYCLLLRLERTASGDTMTKSRLTGIYRDYISCLNRQE
jgi:predicted ester cyclase